MLNHKKLKPDTLSLAQKVKYGIDVGVIIGAEDYICAKCHNEDLEGNIYELSGEWYCPRHGQIARLKTGERYALPKFILENDPKYRGRYEYQLIRRIYGMNNKLAVTDQAQVDGLANSIVTSLAVIKDLPENMREPAAKVLSSLYFEYGIDARRGECGIFPIKNKDNQITGYSIWTGEAAYWRFAHQQAPGNFNFDPPRVLTTDEIMAEGLDICPGACGGSGKTKKWNNNNRRYEEVQCYKCNGKGTLPVENIVAVEVTLVNIAKAKEMHAIGRSYHPQKRIGVYIKGEDTVWNTGNAIAKARKRAEVACLKREFPAMGVYHGAAIEVADHGGQIIESRIVDSSPSITIATEGEYREVQNVEDLLDEIPFEEEDPFPIELTWGQEIRQNLSLYGYRDVARQDSLCRHFFDTTRIEELDKTDGTNLVEMVKRRQLIEEGRLTDSLAGLEFDHDNFGQTKEAAKAILIEKFTEYSTRKELMPSV